MRSLQFLYETTPGYEFQDVNRISIEPAFNPPHHRLKLYGKSGLIFDTVIALYTDTPEPPDSPLRIAAKSLDNSWDSHKDAYDHVRMNIRQPEFDEALTAIRRALWQLDDH